MSKAKERKALARQMGYILGRRPDEFGLIPDADGFVKVKELLKAIGEDPDSRHVRIGHLQELVVTLPDPPIELVENRVRARNRDHLPSLQVTEDLPKLLFTGIRRRAWPAVHERGLFVSTGESIVLSSDRTLAERMARRKDSAAVLLTVQTGPLISRGIMILQYGETLFSAREVPVGCFSGPPLPKEKPHPEPQKKAVRSATPGSFEPDLESILSGDAQKPKNKRKRKREKPPWRR